MNSKLLNIGMVLLCFTFVVLLSSNSEAQNNEIRVSPKSWVGQTVGYTDVNIVFSRPGVKDRKIWGELVPYGKVWRAGANEATKITFSTDVTVEGKKLAKGSYGFFVIPEEKEWTLIFNKVADQWGAYEYNEAEDALRIKVKPQKSDAEEWLDYDIEKINNTTASVSIGWENLEVSFKVEGAAKQ
ncbi:MAG: DUF2911 domain-containing protein [Ignavibacteriaceae bacterium]